ncbi:pyrimidine 5'-nucleotidase [Hamiltosporidium tvaerminnensis]|uniref:Pyrimidine 5'-nucleotidase n=1 Tax=Hamiltosporidium tvaerminnensis TaxID=1176355 RepID=A0A4Q9L9F0_9MICR|nr:hypothetical protein LUQ84_3625 [Hamiltosporidium tvaerminnensis]TBU03895.1 pyrimidine 5'-nucleotidase [Hamiltosporidium tvaerminnensis]TBU12298.1 pyrimidine 5'-nucleotidase [Hamiltosporidium tvaerminnensis]
MSRESENVENIKNVENASKKNTVIYIPITQDRVNEFKNQIFPLNSDILFVFDIEDTLYRIDKEITDLKLKIIREMAQHFKISENEMIKRTAKYTKEYGSPMRGFYDHFKIEPDVLEKTKDVFVDLSHKIDFDIDLIQFLKNLPGRKICLTNSNLKHSSHIFKLKRFDEVFEALIHCDYGDLKYLCKPKEEVFKFVEDIFQVKNTSKIMFYDDLDENIKAAKDRGWNAFKVDLTTNTIQEIVKNSIKTI